MKLRELIKRVNRKGNTYDGLTYNLCSEFEIYDNLWVENPRVTYNWLTVWNGTDTWVGIRVYYLDDISVAISEQKARKADENFEWFSKEAYIETREYVRSLFDHEEPHYEILSEKDLDYEWGTGYDIAYNSQVLGLEQKDDLSKVSLADGTPALFKHYSCQDSPYNKMKNLDAWSKATVLVENPISKKMDKEVVVNMSDIRFPYIITECDEEG